jgi:hypothetical protein
MRSVAADLMAAYDLDRDKIYGHVKTKDRTHLLVFCRHLRSLYPPHVRIAIALDNFNGRKRSVGTLSPWALAADQGRCRYRDPSCDKRHGRVSTYESALADLDRRQ